MTLVQEQDTHFPEGTGLLGLNFSDP